MGNGIILKISTSVYATGSKSISICQLSTKDPNISGSNHPESYILWEVIQLWSPMPRAQHYLRSMHYTGTLIIKLPSNPSRSMINSTTADR